MRSYHLEKQTGTDGIVARDGDVPVPGPHQVLIRVHAVSLNKRDTLIMNNRYPLAATPGVIPLSDGAGEVTAVGDDVTRFRVGDRVTGSYWPRWLDGRLTPELVDQLGCTVDGMLTEYAVLDENAVAAVPDHLTWAEAATLSCAGLTAWTSVTEGEALLPGQTVVTLGTGGVSLFAIQFAKLLGCRVIATTSSAAKAERLTALGADQVINYVEEPEWSGAVLDATGGAGADLVVETGGPATIAESLRAVGLYGEIVLLTTAAAGRPALELPGLVYANSLATLRRVFVGHRRDLEAMNRAIGAHGLRPVIDRTFGLSELSAALDHYVEGRVFGKVVIELGR